MNNTTKFKQRALLLLILGSLYGCEPNGRSSGAGQTECGARVTQGNLIIQNETGAELRLFDGDTEIACISATSEPQLVAVETSARANLLRVWRGDQERSAEPLGRWEIALSDSF